MNQEVACDSEQSRVNRGLPITFTAKGDGQLDLPAQGCGVKLAKAPVDLQLERWVGVFAVAGMNLDIEELVFFNLEGRGAKRLRWRLHGKGSEFQK